MNNRELAVSVRAADPVRDLSAIIRLNRLIQDIHVAVEPSIFRRSDDMPGIEDFHLGFLRDEGRYTVVVEVGTDLVGYVSLELQTRPAHTFANALNFFESLGYSTYNLRLRKTGL